MINDTKFIHVTAALSRAAPQEWAAFLDAYRLYSFKLINDCISSPLDLLPVIQGRAQQVREMQDHLEKSAERADQIEAKMTKNGVRQQLQE